MLRLQPHVVGVAIVALVSVSMAAPVQRGMRGDSRGGFNPDQQQHAAVLEDDAKLQVNEAARRNERGERGGRGGCGRPAED